MTPPMHQQPAQRRRRATRQLVVGVLSTLSVIGLLTWAVLVPTEHAAPRRGPTPPVVPAPQPGWDVAAEFALAQRPMTALPVQAAQPQPLTTDSAGPPIPVPTPDVTRGQWITSGFPGTPEGALGQLTALQQGGLLGGDPAVYAQAYRTMAAPGAPPPEQTGSVRLLRAFRTHAGLPPTGADAGLTVTFQPTHGQIKGTTDGGRFVVACVLGQLSVDYQGNTVTAGFGDCQGVRYVQGKWRIAPIPLPATAPSAWPGSAAAVQAGYRELA